MEQQSFSITAYSVSLKERQKAPKGKTKDDLSDNSKYLGDIHLFLKEFFEKHASIVETDEKVFKMNAVSQEDIGGMKETVFDINYGRNGYPFSVRQNKEDIKYNAEDKIVHYYKVLFYESEDGKAYMIVFRTGHYSCKGAVLDSMYTFLNDSNVLPLIDPIPIPDSLLELGSIESLTSLECDYVEYIETTDNSESPRKKSLKKKCASVCINLEEEKKRKDFFKELIQKITDCFTQTTRKKICERIKLSMNTEEYEPDPDSLKMTVLVKGKKRVIPLADVESLLFSYDVTDKIITDKKGFADLDSIKDVSRNYIKEIVSK